MEVQTQAFDAQGNLISSLKEEKVLSSPSKERRSPSPSESTTDKDPLALKLESALKRSIADRTGNIQLKQEAAREQSMADKMGARAVLSKEQLERTKKEAEQLRIEAAAKQSAADRSGDAALKKEAAAQQHLADKLIASANKSLAALAASEENKTPTQSAPAPVEHLQQDTPLIVQVLQDALKALLESAAQKQSLADRSGDLKMKQEAALAQSKVDKMRAQLQKELQGRPSSPAEQTTPSPVQKRKSPQLTVSVPAVQTPTTEVLRSPIRQPISPTSNTQPGFQQTRQLRQRSPQLTQLLLSKEQPQAQPQQPQSPPAQRKYPQQNSTQSGKPVNRATTDRDWRKRSETPSSAPSSPIPSRSSEAKPRANFMVSSASAPNIKLSKAKVDATTNCSEEEFEQA